MTPEGRAMLEELIKYRDREDRFVTYLLRDPLPPSAPRFQGITLPRERLEDFNDRYRTLLGFASYVLDVPPKEINMLHIMNYIAEKEKP